jgi:hypothetical protein
MSGRPDILLAEWHHWEVLEVVSTQRLIGTIAAIAGFTLVAFSNSSTNGRITSSGPSASLSASAVSSRSRIADESDMVVVEGSGSKEVCENLTCKNIYPQNGIIEGKHVSLITPAGINSRGQIVGLCVLTDPVKNYAFFREPDGDIWLFKTPAASGQGEFTDVSDSGSAVGFYADDSSGSKIGFLMNSLRQWVMDIRYPSNPCQNTNTYLHTQPNGINDNGEIVGNFDCTNKPDDAADGISRGHGFYRAQDGTFYSVEYQNARRTVAGKISNSGIIIGYYVVNENTWRPFAAKKEDVIKPLVP